MGKRDDIFIALSGKDDSFIIDYSNKIFDNLKELNSKEEKYFIYCVITAFLYYLILNKLSIGPIDIGPITLNDVSVVAKFLPVVFIYLVFNLRTITSHKKDVLFTIKTLSEVTLNQDILDPKLEEFGNSFVTRTYLPYSFSNAISKILPNGKINIIEALIGFPLLLPVLLIGILPHVVVLIMLIDLYNNQMEETFGIISFWLTLWGYLLMFFFIVKEVLVSRSENAV